MFINKMTLLSSKVANWHSAKSISKTLSRGRMCVGITVNRLEDINTHARKFSNGLNQHCMTMRDALISFGYDVVFIKSNNKKCDNAMRPYAQMSNPMAIAGCDVILVVGIHIPKTIAQVCALLGISIVYLSLGNDLLYDIDDMFPPGRTSKKLCMECVPSNLYVETWVSPHFWYARHYYEHITRSKVYKVPYFWDSRYTDKTHADMLDIAPGKLSVGVFESNGLHGKNCLFPTIICNKALHEGSINNAVIYCTQTLRKQSWWPRFESLADHPKIKFDNRYVFQGIMSQVCNVVVSWTEDCDLNYLAFECFHLGIPLIHNSKTLRNYGFYYERNEVDDAIEHLRRLNTMGFDRDAYMHKNRKALVEYSIEGSGFLPFFKRRLASLMATRSQESYSQRLKKIK